MISLRLISSVCDRLSHEKVLNAETELPEGLHLEYGARRREGLRQRLASYRTEERKRVVKKMRQG